MTAPKIDAADLPRDVRKRLGIRRSTPSITRHEVRGRAIDVLHVISELTQSDRRRVLRQAIKLNEA